MDCRQRSKIFGQHELISRLSFAVLGPPFEFADALSLDVFRDRKTLIKFMFLVLCRIFPINTILMLLSVAVYSTTML
jgi:hypothetical protein